MNEAVISSTATVSTGNNSQQDMISNSNNNNQMNMTNNPLIPTPPRTPPQPATITYDKQFQHLYPPASSLCRVCSAIDALFAMVAVVQTMAANARPAMH